MKLAKLILSITIGSFMAFADDRATHTPNRHYALGYVPDAGFPKGVLAFEVSPFRNTPVQSSVDLSQLMIPDDDQGQVGRCTGFGLARCFAASYKKLTGSFLPQVFSPDFIYYNERVFMRTVNQDSGAMIGQDGIATLQSQGACFLKTWPLTATLNTKKPSKSAYTEALQHVVIHAYKIDNRHGQDLEAAMSAGFPVVFGIVLKQSFEYLDATHFVYKPSGPVIGGHCMVFFKYDLKKKTITGHNQWGAGWGRSDTFDMALSIAHSSAVDDCYAIDAVKQ